MPSLVTPGRFGREVEFGGHADEGGTGADVGMTGDQLRASVGAFGAVFRNPGLRRINLAYAGSVIGDWGLGLLDGAGSR